MLALRLLLAFFSQNAVLAYGQVPPVPTDACLRDCTSKMQSIVRDFMGATRPLPLRAAVYNGDCFLKSRDYHPDHAHRAMVLVDRHPHQAGAYFATSFAFFAAADEFADWDLARAQRESYGAWEHYGPIEIEENTFRVTTLDPTGNPAWVYYARQNPESETVYYITRWGTRGDYSFCELRPNVAR